MSLYVDPSCLWKLLMPEPGSAETQAIIAAEPRVVVSSLAELEVELQLRAQLLGGLLRPRIHAAFVARLAELRDEPPLVHQPAPADLVRVALAQTRKPAAAYCRTLDRLHLAAMEALGADRLLTNDDRQAAAARALGFGVVRPR
jgi:predicted nucleic acid-binding protein